VERKNLGKCQRLPIHCQFGTLQGENRDRKPESRDRKLDRSTTQPFN
jgi:hypothetical protein